MMSKPVWMYLSFAVWVALLCLSPFSDSNYIVRVCANMALFTVLAQSWNFIGGFTGYPSFSTAAFFGLGAYAGAISQNAGLHMVLAWLFATVLVAVFAGLLGWVILRLRGHYFAIGSIAIVEVLRLLVASMTDFTGGGNGLNVRFLPGGPDFIAMVFLYTYVGLMVTMLAVTVWVDRSRLGFGLRCIKQNEDAADMVGVNTTLYKVAAYVLSAMFCGTVGAVYASWTGYIDPTDSFEILLTLKVPVMAMLGGAGTVIGPVVGASTFLLLEEFFWANFLEYNRAILGLVVVVLIFFLPGGLLNLNYGKLRDGLRRRFGAHGQEEKAS
jgi:branched-chain amino acid transport system permease protein